MKLAGKTRFEFITAAMHVERAVAELRFGRPVVMRDGARLVAVMALDCVAPSVYDDLAEIAGGRHALVLTATRAARLGLSPDGDVAVPLAGISFDQASQYAYGFKVASPAHWQTADPLMSASAELARIALLLPAMVCADVSADLAGFAACCAIDKSHLEASEAARQSFETVVRTRVPLKEFGHAEFVVFRGGLAQKDQVAIVVGKPDLGKPVSVRIHSSCITGDLCGSLKCDCGDQLRNGLALLQKAGGGVLLYLDQEGRGTGIGTKMRAYGYQHRGLDTIDADAELGLGPDDRRYDAAVAMLRLLNISKVAIYTNNPEKIKGLSAAGIEVADRKAVTGLVTLENQGYLLAKTLRAGHMLDLASLIAAE